MAHSAKRSVSLRYVAFSIHNYREKPKPPPWIHKINLMKYLWLLPNVIMENHVVAWLKCQRVACGKAEAMNLKLNKLNLGWHSSAVKECHLLTACGYFFLNPGNTVSFLLLLIAFTYVRGSYTGRIQQRLREKCEWNGMWFIYSETLGFVTGG